MKSERRVEMVDISEVEKDRTDVTVYVGLGAVEDET